MGRPTLTLTAGQRARLEAAARTAHPEECCGVLLGRALGAGQTVVETLLAADNVSVDDRRHSYTIDPTLLLEARRRAEAAGTRLVGFYHSHPDGRARPSAHDARDAWPQMSYLIVPRGGEITSWRRDAGGQFTREAIVEIDSLEEAAR